MILPPLHHPIWQELVTGEKSITFEFLAIKIFLGRAQMVLFSDHTPETMRSLTKELRRIFENNLTHPAIERDIARLLHRERISS